MLDPQTIRLQARRFAQRAANFVKPAPVVKPLTVEQVLASQSSADLVESFSNLWYKSGTPGELNWRGDAILKNPCDLWMIVELFQTVKPRLVIETGTHRGGSSSFYADMTRLLGLDTTIITIDLNPKWSFDPRSKGIESVVGYSTDASVVAKVKRTAADALARKPGPVMLLLDSDHSEENVFREMELYSELVTVGSYMIVEDTNVNGHPSSPEHGPGPWEAVERFLKVHSSFVVDRNCERFLLTFFPRGWLKRVH